MYWNWSANLSLNFFESISLILSFTRFIDLRLKTFFSSLLRVVSSNSLMLLKPGCFLEFLPIPFPRPFFPIFKSIPVAALISSNNWGSCQSSLRSDWLVDDVVSVGVPFPSLGITMPWSGHFLRSIIFQVDSNVFKKNRFCFNRKSF